MRFPKSLPSACLNLLALSALLLQASCSKSVSRQEYVESWILASLRAFEKDTPVRSELMSIYRAAGLGEEDWKDAEGRWFAEETQAEINFEMLALLRARGNIGRSSYVLFRSLAYVRSRALQTGFGGEIEKLGARRGFSMQAWRAAERIWVGDGETDSDIMSRISRLESAIAAVPARTYIEISSDAKRAALKEGLDADLLEKQACKDRGIDPGEFDVAAGVWRDHESIEAEIRRRMG